MDNTGYCKTIFLVVLIFAENENSAKLEPAKIKIGRKKDPREKRELYSIFMHY